MKKIIVIAAIIFTSLTVLNAQKLPNKQEGGLRAPANIKIDGKTIEWGDQFKAYNHATELYYTIANDDNNLYLAIQATNKIIISKIINGGITFAVVAPGKKTKDAMSITFPVFEQNAKPGANFAKGDIQHSSSTTTVYSDSLVLAANKRLASKSKLIMVTGIKGVDTVISVYNTDGIKTAQLYDNKMAYTYELAVSLKQLGLSINNPEKFSYHITLNGISILPAITTKAAEKLGTAQVSAVGMSAAPNILNIKIMADSQSTAPTDFGGEYVLVKK